MTILEKGALVVNNQGCEARVLRLEGKGKVQKRLIEIALFILIGITSKYLRNGTINKIKQVSLLS